ncbi:MAG: ABC transporter permease subunit, partial [Candidatus Bathyarchaeota archaeon]|nr:ABC transporter permease subunit [Candidatus Bathyarchaeota archaeon]
RLMERTSAGTYKPAIKIGLSGIGHLGTVGPRWLHIGDRIHRPKSLILGSKWLKRYTRLEKAVAFAATVVAFFAIIYFLFGKVPSVEVFEQAFADPEFADLPVYIALTMGRLGVAYAISLCIALGMGVLAAEHKKFAAIFYPIYDIGQAVPILALFPVLFITFSRVFGGTFGLEVTAIVVLILDMIWYMFLNVVSAVKSIPSEMKEVGHLFGFKGLKRITHLVIPAILPAIVTGSILSWGTGWNTIIFAEYMPYETDLTGGQPLSLPGLGSYLDKTGYLPPPKGNPIRLLFLLGIIAAIVLLMEGLVWRRLLRKFERYRVEV